VPAVLLLLDPVHFKAISPGCSLIRRFEDAKISMGAMLFGTTHSTLYERAIAI
jgi:hypothetical protein